MPYARKRQKPKLPFQQQSSEDSCMSNTSSPSKTHRHRRTSSFTRQLSDDSGSSISAKFTTIKAMDPLNVSEIHSGSDVKDCYSPESSKSESNFFLACQDDISISCLPALELIRELSFDTPRPHKAKKRADTAGTVTSSSSSETMSADTADRVDRSHITSPVGLDLDLKPSRDLRARSLSPLRGLQYLPDHEDIFIAAAKD